VTTETVRRICIAFPGVTEDVKWGNDLVFSVAGRMFAAADLEPPHSLAFKCTPEGYAELIERPGLTPAPYLARAMWAQETELGSTLTRRELEQQLRTAYELVRARLPKSTQAALLAPAASRGGRRTKTGSPRRDRRTRR
jgi:predicted DNA-binding protein (MmcQ/YjbR family)